MAQPLVVATMTPLPFTFEYPTKVQCMASAHEMAFAAPELGPPLEIGVQCTPSVVRMIVVLPEPPTLGPETPAA